VDARRCAAAALGAAAILAQVSASPAAAPATLTLRTDLRDTGWVRVEVRGTPGGSVSIAERAGATRRPVTTVRLDGGRSAWVRAVSWRCDRRRRVLVATARGPDSTAQAIVRTPSCRHRLTALVAPARPRAGRAFAVRIADRWRLGGVAASVCLRAPRGRPRCRHVALAPRRRRVAVRLRAPRPGRWTVDVRTGWRQRILRRLRVRPRAGRLRVLATGDSMIQILDIKLRERLPGASVRSDARVGTGISKGAQLDWVALAGRQARGVRPDVTVMFIGPNEGFPIRGHPCCGPAWIAAYAVRARRMMRVYARGGAGQVYWLLLPAARDRRFQRVFVAVNAALRRAAAGLAPAVRVIHLDRLFTPGGRFRTRMRIGGRLVTVRQGDGVHLSVAGAAIAAAAVVRAMRADGVL
jgi:lysophospholipase L1-like esterase